MCWGNKVRKIFANETLFSKVEKKGGDWLGRMRWPQSKTADLMAIALVSAYYEMSDQTKPKTNWCLSIWSVNSYGSSPGHSGGRNTRGGHSLVVLPQQKKCLKVGG